MYLFPSRFWSKILRRKFYIYRKRLRSSAQFLHHFSQKCDDNSNPRAFFIFSAMDIIISYLAEDLDPYSNGIIQNRNNIQKRITCLNLFMASSPLPLVTVEDIDFCLESFYRDYFYGTLRDIIHATFQELFPKHTERLMPRTLKDLCRSKFRESLQGSLTLPEYVKLQNIPKSLKSYLLIED